MASRYLSQSPERRRAYFDRYYAEKREAILEKNRQWRRNNRARVNSLRREAQARKYRAVPKWADRAKIHAVYEEARRLTVETGVQHEVDHIVPLKHTLVCGLHVHNNLRAIPHDENARKHNKFEVA